MKARPGGVLVIGSDQERSGSPAGSPRATSGTGRTKLLEHLERENATLKRLFADAAVRLEQVTAELKGSTQGISVLSNAGRPKPSQRKAEPTEIAGGPSPRMRHARKHRL